MVMRIKNDNCINVALAGMFSSNPAEQTVTQLVIVRLTRTGQLY